MLVDFNCAVCGKECTRQVAAGVVPKYCSRDCMAIGRRKHTELVDDLLCHKCLIVKPVSDFYKHNSLSRGYQYWCRECTHAERVERVKLPVDPHVRRRHALWSAYRITPDDYENMYNNQQGRCGICKTPKERWEPAALRERLRFLMVDHDHTTGKVRGLLCSECNHGLGKFKDNQEYLRLAIGYLEQN